MPARWRGFRRCRWRRIRYSRAGPVMSERTVTMARIAAERIGRAVVTLVVSAALFSVLPIMHNLFGSAGARDDAASRRTSIIMETRLQRKERQRTQQRRTRTIRASAGRSRGKSYDLKFTPDLSVSSGSGVGVEQADLESMVFEEGETDEAAVLLRRTSVPYPRRAVEMGIEGTAVLEIVVGRDGRVESVTVIRVPHPVLRKPLTETVERWRFRPAKQKGIPVRMRVRQSIDFRLDQ
ncbi:MAG: TonB family protein [Chitinivibrionales bacterium]|nr:TonB family protein [Chitinivibrionales bacterium]